MSEFVVSEQKGITIVRLPEVVDEMRAVEMAEELDAVEQKSKLRIVIDCEILQLITSTPIGHLIGLISRAGEAGGRITLATLPKHVERVFWTVRLNQLLDTYATVEEALESYQAGSD